MFCKNCGNELQDGEKFCTKCGSKVNRLNSKVILIVLGITIILIVTIISIFIITKNSKSDNEQQAKLDTQQETSEIEKSTDIETISGNTKYILNKYDSNGIVNNMYLMFRNDKFYIHIDIDAGGDEYSMFFEGKYTLNENHIAFNFDNVKFGYNELEVQGAEYKPTIDTWAVVFSKGATISNNNKTISVIEGNTGEILVFNADGEPDNNFISQNDNVENSNILNQENTEQDTNNKNNTNTSNKNNTNTNNNNNNNDFIELRLLTGKKESEAVEYAKSLKVPYKIVYQEDLSYDEGVVIDQTYHVKVVTNYKGEVTAAYSINVLYPNETFVITINKYNDRTVKFKYHKWCLIERYEEICKNKGITPSTTYTFDFKVNNKSISKETITRAEAERLAKKEGNISDEEMSNITNLLRYCVNQGWCGRNENKTVSYTGYGVFDVELTINNVVIMKANCNMYHAIDGYYYVKLKDDNSVTINETMEKDVYTIFFGNHGPLG